MSLLFKKGKKEGFTLLEVMVALSIIVIVMTVLIGSQSRGLSLAIESKFEATAALLARERLSQLEMIGDDEIISDSGDFGEDFAPYKWSLAVERVDVPGAPVLESRFLRLDLTVFLEENDKYQYTIREYRFINRKEY